MINDFLGDSAEYEVLAKGVELSKDIHGMCVELGLRLGAGMATIIDVMAQFCPHKVALSIDCYGNLPYEGREGKVMRLDYTEQMRSECLSKMYPYALSKAIHWKFIEMKDTDFFINYRNGVPVYQEERRVESNYSFVHLDGPHNIAEISAELDFFLPRMLPGSILALDDVTPDFYDIKAVEQHMAHRVRLVHMGQKKALYSII